MTTKQITAKETTALTTPRTGPAPGMESMGQKDLLLSTYSIVQPVSRGDKGKAPAGFFYDSLTGAATDCIQAVILRLSPSRTLWAGQGTGGGPPECSSYDGVRGNVHGACAACSFNRWTKDKLEKTCKSGYMLICANMDSHDNIFMFRATGMSVRPIKALYTELNGLWQAKGIPSFGHHVKLETEYHEPDTGKYYTIKAQVIQTLTPEQRDHYEELYHMIGGANIVEEAAPTASVVDEDIF